MLSLFTFFILLLVLYYGSFLAILIKNYLAARKCGVPIVILPIAVNHVVWMIIGVMLRPSLKRYLPYWLYARIAVGIFGWEFHEKRWLFRELNCSSFVLVTCSKNELWTQDPEINAEILRLPNDYIKSEIARVVMEPFGPSVLTSEGESWARQRKLITGIINERISKVVFEETWKQSSDMLDDIESNKQSTNVDQTSNEASSGFVYAATFPAMKRIASNVLFRTAYGLPQRFKEPTETQSTTTAAHGSNRKLDMLDCINIVIANLVPAGFFSEKTLLSIPSWLPLSKWAHTLGAAKDQFPILVRQRLDQERAELAKAGDGEVRSNLTSMLVQASEYGNEETEATSKVVNGKEQRMLSEAELRGNLFVFTVAGFETTANALTFALVALMADPDLQDWICEEVDELFAKARTGHEEAVDDELMDYAVFYPKAIRCLALMLEVLRLYPPVIHVSRATLKHKSTVVKTGADTYTIPEDSHVYTSLPALHTDPQVWRNLNLPGNAEKTKSETSETVIETMEDVQSKTQDEYLFRPSRWVNGPLKQMPDGSMSKPIFQPPRGAYAPFSGGPRVCPGQKMAQVEFVCVILTLFRKYKIEVVKLPGENQEKSQERLAGVLRDCHAELTMVMDRLHEIEVRFVRRK